jgi:HSP20 family molecular chaperone IbpA
MELKNQEVNKQEITNQEQTERTRKSRLFIPRVDIYETKDAIRLSADIPGADMDSIDVTLEKNILTIEAHVSTEKPVDYDLTYAEYGIGDFQRRFTLSNEIDHNGIVAKVKDGVLNLTLPKIGPTEVKKISVSSE